MHVERSGRNLVLHAPAKLNLFLEVLGRRPDGFHELETLMVPVGLYDTLFVTPTEPRESAANPADSIHFTCDWSALERTERVWKTAAPSNHPAPERPQARENLAYRALDLLCQRTGCRRGARVHLVKRIPLAAGLGGGSSDAAAALVAGNLAWDLRLSRHELASLAAELGSDVPFFLAEGTAICRGRGERVEPVTLGGAGWFVIARPAAGLSTADVFRACRPSGKPRSVAPLVASLQSGDWRRARGAMHNALQPAAEGLCDEVARVKEAFGKLELIGHQMSGSGTSYFGSSLSRRGALRAAARLRAARLGSVFVVAGEG